MYKLCQCRVLASWHIRRHRPCQAIDPFCNFENNIAYTFIQYLSSFFFKTPCTYWDLNTTYRGTFSQIKYATWYTTKLFPHLSETIQCSRAGNHNIVEVIWIRTSQYIYWTRWRHLHVEHAICQFANEAYQAATWRNALWSCRDISF